VVDPTASQAQEQRPRLSICIATFKRAAFIGETLRCIAAQLRPDVEVVVVDGASPDDTPEVVRPFAERDGVRYFREAVNSGVDADYDKAVGYARGKYCWLMTDDDLLVPGAVARVLDAVADGPDLVVVNAETRTNDLSLLLDARLLRRTTDAVYEDSEREELFVEAASYLTFIGGVVIRRDAWMARDRASYYGSLFIHLGVIFQDPPLQRTRVLAEPLVSLRWGNAMWAPRSFEIWMFKWPALVWSFAGLSPAAKARVCPREPWRNLKMLGLHRALGSYSISDYRTHLGERGGAGYRLVAAAIAVAPRRAACALAAAYCLVAARSARRELYDLAYGVNSTWVARSAARLLGLRPPGGRAGAPPSR
jgi:glycosyltransferase involved in cell wall biosynthesis